MLNHGGKARSAVGLNPSQLARLQGRQLARLQGRQLGPPNPRLPLVSAWIAVGSQLGSFVHRKMGGDPKYTALVRAGCAVAVLLHTFSMPETLSPDRRVRTGLPA